MYGNPANNGEFIYLSSHYLELSQSPPVLADPMISGRVVTLSMLKVVRRLKRKAGTMP